MRRAALAVTLAAAALLACGDDGDATDTGTSDATTTSAADPALDGCATDAVAGAPGEALAAFPDNPDVTWTVLGSREGGLGTVLVELEPDPDEVGYPRFTFVFACGTDEPVRLATYALDGDEYVLLATTDAAEGVELAPVLEE